MTKIFMLCMLYMMQNFLKDHMDQIAAFMCQRIPRAGLRMFMYDVFIHSSLTLISTHLLCLWHI